MSRKRIEATPMTWRCVRGLLEKLFDQNGIGLYRDAADLIGEAVPDSLRTFNPIEVELDESVAVFIKSRYMRSTNIVKGI